MTAESLCQPGDGELTSFLYLRHFCVILNYTILSNSVKAAISFRRVYQTVSECVISYHIITFPGNKNMTFYCVLSSARKMLNTRFINRKF